MKKTDMKTVETVGAAALILGSSIFVSRLLGYVREMLLAHQYGASATTDAFYAAFQIPDLLNYFLAGGAMSIAFIPLYNKVLARDGEKAANGLAAAIFTTLAFLVITATALLWWKAEALTRLQFPKFDETTTALTVQLTRIVLPAQIFFITGGILQAILLARRNFTAAALAPLVYNGFIIAGGYFLHPYMGIGGFALGTLAGAILGPFLMPLLFMRGHISLDFGGMAFKKDLFAYLLLAAPLMLGQTLLTLDEWYGRWFGALLDPGTVAHISYARKLMLVPIAVIGQAMAQASLPILSKKWAEGKIDDLNDTLLKTLKTGLTLAILSAGAMLALATPLVTVVYRHGAFTGTDAVEVAALLMFFSLAIPGWILQQISLRAFYARGQTWQPMLLGTLISLAAIPLYLTLSQIHGAPGLAMAGALGMAFNALCTLTLAKIMHKISLALPLFISFLRSLAITLPATVAAFYTSKMFYTGSASGTAESLGHLLLAGGAFGAVALPMVFILGDSELKERMRGILSRLIRKPEAPGA